jgi:hypothetical protein
VPLTTIFKGEGEVRRRGAGIEVPLVIVGHAPGT